MKFDFKEYELIRKVGEGGMSSVWQARVRATNAIVAVKILKHEYSANKTEVKAFKEEEKLMEEIRHPGIVEGYRVLFENGYWLYIMEFVDGYTFGDFLKRKKRIEEADCLLICESVASALNVAWNDHGVVHCDIKPENIMINSSGVVKLTDLGIAHRFKADHSGTLVVPDHVLGTPAYISPEQIYGDVQLDCRADIYSLGATLYHLATGRVLFAGESYEDMMRSHCADVKQADDPRRFAPNLSEGFVQLLEVMLIKDREERLASWETVYQMCRDIESGIAFKPRRSHAPSSIKINSL